MNIYVEGHRGWRSDYPENTLPSFEAAMDLGVDVFEFDIRTANDGTLVISHDDDLFRCSGVHAFISEMTLEEIKKIDVGSHVHPNFGPAYVPTLEEVLKLVVSKNPNFKLGVEIKTFTEECVDKSVALLKQYGVFENCWFYCFNARIIKYIKQKYNGRTMGYPDFQMKEFEADSYDYYDEIGISMAVMHSEVFHIFKAKNLPIHFYCANDEKTVKECIDNGASLITADNPVPLMKVLGRK